MWIDVIIGLRMSVFQIRLVRLFIATTFNTHDRSVDILLQSPVDPFSTKRDLSASMHPKRIVCSILRSYQMFKKIQHKHAASICFLWSVNQIFIASKVWKQPSEVFYKKDVLLQKPRESNCARLSLLINLQALA